MSEIPAELVVAAADAMEQWLRREDPDVCRLLFRSSIEELAEVAAPVLLAAGRRQAADDLFETLRAAGVYAVHTPDGRIYQLADVAFAVPTADIAEGAPAEPVEGVDRG